MKLGRFGKVEGGLRAVIAVVGEYYQNTSHETIKGLIIM